MKNKVLIIAVIIAFICGLLVGIKLKNLNFATIKEPKEEKKTTLIGLYMTEEKEPHLKIKDAGQELKQVERETITIYDNSTLVIQRVTIYYLEGIGQEICKGMANSYHYVINNETKSILLTSMDGKNSSKTYTFTDDYNTILDDYKTEYTSFKGGIEDYYKGEDYKRERETNFEGTYELVRGDNVITYTFNKNGVVNCKTVHPNVAPTEEINNYYYCIDNDKVFIYQKQGNYSEGTLSDNNTKLIMTNSYSIFSEQSSNPKVSSTYLLKQ